ncbi:hypothetical protein FB567DRAFT_594969 [Paraphoma chrysanthemicola]|uniref:Uncharacterized protein n=1 Tax=Paraphoma chrysanthemicola TaxID=798071 RepID=A0A8K0VWX6_9PLEO|nr:hypothetical protein FB567DRAFT_594969 [Paraphoma chrysanthemicola]
MLPQEEDDQYRLLSDDQSESDDERHTAGLAGRSLGRKWAIFRLVSQFVAGFSISLIVLLFVQSFQVNNERRMAFTVWDPSSACGTSPEEAAHRGCVYDEVLLHWMPEKCSSPLLIDEFVHVWPWKFWTEKATTRELSLAEVREGNQIDKWVSFGLHRWHCVATWKALTLAATTGTTVPAYALDWNHTVHCSDHVLMNAHSRNPFSINSHLDIEYTPCVRLAIDNTLKRRGGS